MTRKEAIEILRKHNEWRRYDGPIGEGPEMTNPTVLGEAIDLVVSTELTWEDIKDIDEWISVIQTDSEYLTDREVYQEVLHRFNEQRNEKD